MVGYRVYFIGQDGHFVSVADLEAKDDDEALALAGRLYAIRAESVGWTYVFELWQGPRIVHRERERKD